LKTNVFCDYEGSHALGIFRRLGKWEDFGRMASRLLRPSVAVLLFYSLYVIGVLSTRNFDPTAFIKIGIRYLNRDPHNPVVKLVYDVGFGPPYWDMGYDGQWYYYLALDPINAWGIFDNLGRYQRILYPLIVRFFALGKPHLVPYTMIVVNLVAIVVGTEITSRLLHTLGANPWYSLAYGWHIGQLYSLRYDLAEPLAYMFVLLAVYTYEKKRDVNLCAFFFGLSLFTKETAALFIGGSIASFLITRNFRGVKSILSRTLLPYVMYQLFLYQIFGIVPFFTTGAAPSPHSIMDMVPFYGAYLATLSMNYPLPEFLIMTFLIFIPSLLSFFIFIERMLARDHNPSVFALVFNAVFMMFLPKDAYLGPLNFNRISMGLATSFLTCSTITKKRWALNYSLLWILPFSTHFRFIEYL